MYLNHTFLRHERHGKTNLVIAYQKNVKEEFTYKNMPGV